MLKTLKQKDTDYQFPTEALYTRKRVGVEIEQEEKHTHTQHSERSKMSERFQNSSILEEMGEIIAQRKQRLRGILK